MVDRQRLLVMRGNAEKCEEIRKTTKNEKKEKVNHGDGAALLDMYFALPLGEAARWTKSTLVLDASEASRSHLGLILHGIQLS